MELVLNNTTVAENKTANNMNEVSATTESGAKKLAWQLLGTNFSEPITIKEAIEQAGANYNVVKQPLVKLPQWAVDAILKGESIDGLKLTANDIISNHYATVADDTNHTLGIVGKNYGIVQNEAAFDFISAIKDTTNVEPIIETCGVLGNGRRVFVSAKYDTQMSLGSDDNVENYVLFTNTHDGSGAVTCLFTPVRVVCQNTLNMALSGCANKISFRHTKFVGERIKMINQFMREQKRFRENFINVMKGLQGEKISPRYLNEFAARVYIKDDKETKEVLTSLAEHDFNIEQVDGISTRTKNLVNSLKDSIESGVGQQFDRGTKLWLLNGLTTHFHNTSTYKSAEEEYDSILSNTGDANKKVQRAFGLLNSIAA